MIREMMKKNKIGMFVILIEISFVIYLNIEKFIFVFNNYEQTLLSMIFFGVLELVFNLFLLLLANVYGFVIVNGLYKAGRTLKNKWLIFIVPIGVVIIGVALYFVGVNKIMMSSNSYLFDVDGLIEIFTSYFIFGSVGLTLPYYFILYDTKFKQEKVQIDA